MLTRSILKLCLEEDNSSGLVIFLLIPEGEDEQKPGWSIAFADLIFILNELAKFLQRISSALQEQQGCYR